MGLSSRGWRVARRWSQTLRLEEEMMVRKTVAAAVLASGLALAPALDAVNAQGETTEESDDSGKVGLFGLAGLLGLAGLAGLKRRDRVDQRRDSRHWDGHHHPLIPAHSRLGRCTFSPWRLGVCIATPLDPFLSAPIYSRVATAGWPAGDPRHVAS